MLTGVFEDRDSAERAFCAAIALGYEPSDIDMIMSEETRKGHFSETAGHPFDERSRTYAESEERAARVGGPTGATAATLAPALAATGAVILVPGVLMAGPIATALVAAGMVGVAGGIVGALTDWGIPHDRREEYADAIRRGAIVLGLDARSRADARAVRREWQAAGGRLIHA